MHYIDATHAGSSDPSEFEPAQNIDKGRIEIEIEQLVTKIKSEKGIPIDVLDRLSDIARKTPELLIPYVHDIAALADSAANQVRNGSLQTLSILSRVAPTTMAFLLPRMHDLLANEPAEVIREQALEIVTNYAKTGRAAAEKVIPILTATVDKFGTQNALRVIGALTQVVQSVPKIGKETIRIVDQLQHSVVTGVRIAAGKLSHTLKRNGDSE